MEKSRKLSIACIIGPTASGKSARAVRLARERGGEIISVDSRQVYRSLDIGTEKITSEEMDGIPHHLIDVREPEERYSAGDFIHDAQRLIREISARGKVPILVGGTHYYFDALLFGVPEIGPDEELRARLEQFSSEELFERIATADPRRAAMLDPQNRRRLIRALEIIENRGRVPERKESASHAGALPYEIEWIVLDTPRDELRARIDARLQHALDRGLIEETRALRARVHDERLNEFGLEYRVVGEYLRGERAEDSLFPALSSRLWHYARRQKAWLRKLRDSLGLHETTVATAPHPDRN